MVHRDENKSSKIAPFKKNIYSLAYLMVSLNAVNQWYLEFISAFDNMESSRKRLENIITSKQENNCNNKGFNFFWKKDHAILISIFWGEFNIYGLRNKDLRKLFGYNGEYQPIVKTIVDTWYGQKSKGLVKVLFTKLEKETIVMVQRIKEQVLIPAYCY